MVVSKLSCSAFLRSPAHREMDSSTDTAILYLDVPAQQARCVDALQMPLRALPGIYEVAVARSTGSHVRASLKGTAQALDEAQKRLGRALGPGVTIAGSQPEETKKPLPAKELQQKALADAGFEKDDARMPASGAATEQPCQKRKANHCAMELSCTVPAPRGCKRSLTN